MGNDTYSTGGSVRQDTRDPGTVEETEHLLARDVMQYGVLSIGRDEPVHKAIALLVEHEISALPVTQEKRLVGMLSEKDLLRLLYETEYLPGVVEDYMTSDVTSFDVETRLAVIHKQLIERPFRRVPILFRGRLAGMITRGISFGSTRRNSVPRPTRTPATQCARRT